MLLDRRAQSLDSECSCAVVVASFRPGPVIDRCLAAILAQKGIEDFEVIVVDSSADGTAERLQREFPTIDVIALAQQTPQSIARNIGIARTQARFIAITDQDCIVPADWVACLLARHQEGEYAAVGGAVSNGTPESVIGTASYLIEFNEFLPTGTPRLVTMIPHCNVCFRREVFTKTGPFRAVPPGAEDRVFNFLLCCQGYQMLFDPTIVVDHLNRTSFSAFLQHQHLLGFGSAIARRTVAIEGQVFIRHPGLAYSLPLVRLARTIHRLSKGNRATLLRYLRLLPVLLPGYTAWTAGFLAGLRHEVPPEPDLTQSLHVTHYPRKHHTGALSPGTHRGVLVMGGKSVSVIIPVLNEARTLSELIQQVDQVLQPITESYEIIVIDDGSEDDTPAILRELAARYPKLSVVRFRRNYGKAAALSEGFARAQGDFLITLDGDLQDDPEEIPRLLEELTQRVDVVCGWKRDRKDPWTRVLSSRVFNAVTRLLTGLNLHDINCGLKGYRRQVVQELRLYGEMHRFIPVIARQRGFTVGELAVRHFPRRFGRSRYGWSRLLSGLFDLITLLMLGRYTHKPLHFFGILGLGFSLMGAFILLVLGIGWLQGQWIGNRPLFLVGIFLVLSGTQFIFFGLLAELLIYLSAQREDCGIAEIIGNSVGNGDVVASPHSEARAPTRRRFG